ncbi:MAG: isoprenyl transferase [Leptospira sp.]|nr:isoprenyl transferase [Leptospira sp.]
MDGNGRWATARGLKRSDGHREGAVAIDKLMDSALSLGLQSVSLYAFSTENWKRPILEIRAIFDLLIEFIDSRLDSIHEKGIQIKHSGSRSKIPKSALASIDKAVAKTSKNRKLIVNFCLNYGSQDEILTAMNRLLEDRKMRGKPLDEKIKSKEFEKYLYTYPLSPVDLLIRTAGEERISNFLLWQIAYAEVYFTDTLWPDFGEVALWEALRSYEKRIRKFGGL